MQLIDFLVPDPPIWVMRLGWVLVVVFAILFIYGVILIIRSHRKTQAELQEKDSLISEQRERLSKLRERLSEPALLAIPNILTKINGLNRAISSNPTKSIAEKQISDLEDYVLQNNIWRMMSWLFNRKNMNKLLGILIRLSTEMNNRDIGLRADKLTQYEKLKAGLDEKRQVIGNPLLKRRIREYLAWSDGLYSFRLLLKYHFSVQKLTKWFPNRLRFPDDEMLLAFDSLMDEMLGQVVKAIEESLIGRSDSGTGNV